MGGGYRMARASHGTDSGCWYYEVHIDKDKVAAQDAAYRVGFAHKKADLQGPCGMDRYSKGFGYRNIEGSLVHASHRVDQANEPYKAGDIIGCLINFQSDELEDIESDHPGRRLGLPEGPPKAPGQLRALLQERQGPGRRLREHPAGRPRAAASVFRTGTFRLNFGPRFSAGRRRQGPRGAAAGGGADGHARLRVGPAPRHAARATPSRKLERRLGGSSRRAPRPRRRRPPR